ncbi:HAD family hydrolase [Streptomyces albus subsp. chlorinus]|uniref:HAD family hydrolase n=1 Tax=Streptomyces albus TaxID=1888 RepID=UPI00156DE4D7|nr:HAD family hydrolase [Streptomyces albus]NSC22497.1 HAD family hydrolase [Streptomyces albus subsp. chlorinus]
MRELTSAQCVIFDFDGPLCRLFARRTAASVAARLWETYVPHAPRDSWPHTPDPLRLLATAFEAPSPLPRGTAHELEHSLTQEEIAAAEGAFPTGYADALVRTLGATGRRPAVATDNSAAAVERYLAGRGLLDAFAGRVCGRRCDADGPRLKPDPDCVRRALEATGTPAADAVMIGDSARDLGAARAAGVAFVGYARNDRKEAELRTAGAIHVVGSLKEILLTVDPLAHV